eukprot:3940501-Rhodomonas_salina.3
MMMVVMMKMLTQTATANMPLMPKTMPRTLMRIPIRMLTRMAQGVCEEECGATTFEVLRISGAFDPEVQLELDGFCAQVNQPHLSPGNAHSEQRCKLKPQPPTEHAATTFPDCTHSL